MASMNMDAGSDMPNGSNVSDARIKTLDVSVIGHEGKRKAIQQAINQYQQWFKELQNITPESHAKAQGWDKYKNDPRRKLMYESLINDTQKLSRDMLRVGYLGTLPWIGKITKWHLARNMGIDVAKPDRHLVRLCEEFGFKDVQKMCGFISKRTGDRIGLVDVILWRALNLGFDNGRGEDATKKVV